MLQNDTPDDHLTSKQQNLIALLVSGIAMQGACKEVGITPMTGYRWLKLPHFQQAYRTAQDALFDEALASLMADISTAIAGIKSIAGNSEIAAQVRLRAYQIWLEQSLEVSKMRIIEQKIAALEEALRK